MGEIPDDHSDVRSRSNRSRSNKSKTKKDLKHILESSSVIDQIFEKRTKKIEAERKVEADKKAAEEAEYKEVIEANASLKNSLTGKGSLSGGPSGANHTNDDKSSTGKPVNTTKEFLNTIND